MKTRLFNIIVLVILISFSSLFVKAQDSGLGLGLYLGEPTGVGYKAWVAPNGAIAGAVAWSFVGAGHMHVHADYHRHSFTLIEVEKGKLPVYYGIGAKIVFQNNPIFGARIPLGLNYIFEDAPLDIFAELAPGMEIIPVTEFDLAGGFGIRFFFN